MNSVTEIMESTAYKNNEALYKFRENLALIEHLSSLQIRLEGRPNSSKALLSPEITHTGLNLHSPDFQQIASQLESFVGALHSPFTIDKERLSLLQGKTILSNPSHIIEAGLDGNAWIVALGPFVEGFCGCGDTLPEALRALADDLEKQEVIH